MRMHVSPFSFVQFLCSRAKDSLRRVIRLCELGLLSPGVHRVNDVRAVGIGRPSQPGLWAEDHASDAAR